MFEDSVVDIVPKSISCSSFFISNFSWLCVDVMIIFLSWFSGNVSVKIENGCTGTLI